MIQDRLSGYANNIYFQTGSISQLGSHVKIIIALLILLTSPILAVEINSSKQKKWTELDYLSWNFVAGVGIGTIARLAITPTLRIGGYEGVFFLVSSWIVSEIIFMPLAEYLYFKDQENIYSGYGSLFSFLFPLVYTAIPLLLLTFSPSEGAAALLALGFFINPALSILGFRLGLYIDGKSILTGSYNQSSPFAFQNTFGLCLKF
ncbi:MAG: hypothetical protein HZC28_03700 [Spirochaetes bacterium]|nr:hypothetical protein [Spirochaetota bacterium]